MTTTTWRTQVIKADRTWSKESVRPVSYKFSNNREFKVLEVPDQPYTWNDQS
jgi:hypothetical protein